MIERNVCIPQDDIAADNYGRSKEVWILPNIKFRTYLSL